MHFVYGLPIRHMRIPMGRYAAGEYARPRPALACPRCVLTAVEGEFMRPDPASAAAAAAAAAAAES